MTLFIMSNSVLHMHKQSYRYYFTNCLKFVKYLVYEMAIMSYYDKNK